MRISDWSSDVCSSDLGFLSRFNMNLRETKGWSYGVYSQVSNDKERLAWVAVSPVQVDRTGDSIKEFRSDLTAFLGDKGTTAAELERTINSNVRALPGSDRKSTRLNSSH